MSSIFLCFSTNGTVINMSKLVKKQTHVLQNGDVIYFVYRKSEPEQSELPLALKGKLDRIYITFHTVYIFFPQTLPTCTTPSGASSRCARMVTVSRRRFLSVVASMWSACLLAHAAASVCTEDTQRSDLSLASASPSERLLSVEPVMLTKTPRDISQEDPQPSTSRSRFCIGSSAEPGPRFPGTFCFFVSTDE